MTLATASALTPGPALRRQVFAGIVALNLLFAVLAGLFLLGSRQQHLAAAQVRLEELALEVERDIDNAYDQADLVLQGLSAHYTDLTRSGHLDEAAWERALSESRLRLPTLLVLRATDAQGLIRHGNSDARGERLDVSKYPEFLRLRDQPDAGLQISQPVKGKSTRFQNTYGIVLARRLTDAQGRFAGITRAVFALDHFAQLFQPLRMGEQGFISVRDDRLRLVLRQPPLSGPNGEVGSSVVSDALRAALAVQPDKGHYTTTSATSLDGIARLHAYRWNGKHRFHTNIGVPLDDVYRPWWREVAGALGLTALFAGMSALMGYGLLRSLRSQQEAAAVSEQDRHALRQQKSLLKDVLDTATVGIFTIDAEGIITLANPSMAAMFGCTLDELMGSSYYERVAPDERDSAREDLQALMIGGAVALDSEWRYCRHGGQRFLGHLTGTRYHDVGNPKVMMAGVIMDVEERRRAEDALRQSEQNFRTLIEHAPFGINLSERDGSFTYINPAWTQLLGYSAGEVANLDAWWPRAYPDPSYRASVMREWQTAVVELEQTEVVERTFRVRCGTGEDKVIAFVVVPLPNSHIVVTVRDVTLEKLHEQQLQHNAHHDSLTGLPNRLLLSDRLAQDMAKTRRAGMLLAVCYLDLDGFKPVNDSHGHDAGDRLLIEMANRLESCVRESDTVARLGGDEFVLLLTVEDVCECETALTRVLEAVAKTADIGVAHVNVSASLGYTVFPLDNGSAAELLDHADRAMYAAKAAGKNRLARYCE